MCSCLIQIKIVLSGDLVGDKSGIKLQETVRVKAIQSFFELSFRCFTFATLNEVAPHGPYTYTWRA